MKETLEILESSIRKISRYADIFEKDLLKIYAAELESNLSLLKEEIKVELEIANTSGYIEATEKALETINNSNK